MKSTVILGVLLVLFGIFGWIYHGFSYTKREKIADIGPVHATRDVHETVPISPIVGSIAIVGGIVLIVSGRRKA
jgi:hypothetical protein